MRQIWVRGISIVSVCGSIQGRLNKESGTGRVQDYGIAHAESVRVVSTELPDVAHSTT